MSSKRVLLNLYYDILSPYSWISFELLCRYRPEWQSMALKFKPVNLAAVFKETDNKPGFTVPNKIPYMVADIKRLNEYYKIPIVIPDNFMEIAMKSSLKAQRFITAIDLLTKGKSTEDISRQLFKRVFVSHQDITLPDSFREAAKTCAIDEEIVEKAIVSMEKNDIKEALKKTTGELVSYGGFGAPTVVIDLPKGPELVFGSDRMPVIASLIGEKYVGPLAKYSTL